MSISRILRAILLGRARPDRRPLFSLIAKCEGARGLWSFWGCEDDFSLCFRSLFLMVAAVRVFRRVNFCVEGSSGGSIEALSSSSPDVGEFHANNFDGVCVMMPPSPEDFRCTYPVSKVTEGALPTAPFNGVDAILRSPYAPEQSSASTSGRL